MKLSTLERARAALRELVALVVPDAPDVVASARAEIDAMNAADIAAELASWRTEHDPEFRTVLRAHGLAA